MKILLFGSTGMLGNYVHNLLKDEYTIVCINRNMFDIETDNWNKLNEIITKYLQEKDIIINCAGIIPQKYKNDDYKQFIRVNTLFPHKLSEISNKKKYYLIHITTDCVFDGEKGLYTTNDTHNALNIYGISKSLGEPEEATVIRTSIIGEEIIGKKSLLEWVKSNKNGNINGFENHYWNGITCLTLAKIIKQIIQENNYWKGIKQIFSPNIVTKYKLCEYINDIYNLNIEIKPCNDKISKNMTLTGDNNFVIDDIYIQLLEQFNFKYLSSRN